MNKFSQHISAEWLDENSLIVVKVTKPTPLELENYVNWLAGVLNLWQREKVFLICYDLRSAAITPYSRFIANRIGEMMPMDLVGRTAVVLPSGLIGTILIQFFAQTVPLSNPHMQRQFFQKVDLALFWLRAFQNFV